MKVKAVSSTGSTHLRERFHVTKLTWKKDEIDGFLEEPTKRGWATFRSSIRSMRLLAAARSRLVQHGLKIVTRSDPRTNVVVYWLETR